MQEFFESVGLFFESLDTVALIGTISGLTVGGYSIGKLFCFLIKTFSNLSKKRRLKKMNYETETTALSKAKKEKGLLISPYVPVYKLDGKGELVKTDEKINVNDVIESFRNTSLQSMLNALEVAEQGLTPTFETDVTEQESTVYALRDDIDVLSEFKQRFADIRSAYNIPSSVTDADLPAYLSKQYDLATADLKVKKQRFDEYRQKRNAYMREVDKTNKESIKNEKED